MQSHRSTCAIVLTLVAISLQATSARAAQIIFTLQPAQSTLSLTGIDDTYGPLVPQAPGSNVSPISGHFLVEFDPAAPTDITFSLGHGYMQPALTGNYLPGPIAQADTDNPSIGHIENPYPGYNTPAPGMLAVQTAGGELRSAYRELAWDFISIDPGSLPPEPFDPYALTPEPIPLSGGNFDLATLGYLTLADNSEFVAENYRFPGDFFGHAHDETDPTPSPNVSGGFLSGTANLVESAPGSGTWTISGTASVVGTYKAHLSPPYDELGTSTFTSNFVATAQFGAANLDAVGSGETAGSVLGGSGTTGGVDVVFEEVTAAGVLSAQSIPTTGLSLQALTVLQSETNFQLAGDTPQIWNVSFDGEFTGPLTLTFGYDESLLGGIPEANLFVLHFDETLGAWEQIFGTVDTDLNTITIATDSLSPFALGVPEPSALVLATCGAAGLLAAACLRRRLRDASVAGSVRG